MSLAYAKRRRQGEEGFLKLLRIAKNIKFGGVRWITM